VKLVNSNCSRLTVIKINVHIDNSLSSLFGLLASVYMPTDPIKLCYCVTVLTPMKTSTLIVLVYVPLLLTHRPVVIFCW